MKNIMMLLAALLIAAPVQGQVLDSIPVPYPVAIGGAFWHVLVDFSPTTQHTTLHGALREAGLRQVECEAAGAPCEVQVCSDEFSDGFCYRMELRWVPFNRPADDPDTLPEPEPEPDPVVIEADSLMFELDSTFVEEGDSIPFTLIVWHDDRAWQCVNLIGQVGLLAARIEVGEWTWDYPEPEFILSPEACDIDVASEMPDIATVEWAPLALDSLPTRPVQFRLQTATGSGQTATATLEHQPEEGNLLVAMLWHRTDWQTPDLLNTEQWTRVALQAEPETIVGVEFRKGLSVWVRRAGPNEPQTVSATWADMGATTRETLLTVWELTGYGDFIDATIASSGSVNVDNLSMIAPGSGALVGLVGARELVQEAAWEGLESPQFLSRVEGDGTRSTILSALGQGDRATAMFGEIFAAIGVLLRFQQP